MKGEILQIERPLFSAMLALVQAEYPYEACGILAGSANRVRHVYAIDNVLRSPVAYEMDPKQQLAAMLDLEKNGWEMLAIFHSHPTGPERPSPTDVAQAYYPESVYLIVSLEVRENPVVRGFRIENGRYHEVTLNVE
jgi:[CysO sulfur-carrier protein]-S-L-cysteine hydrolase